DVGVASQARPLEDPSGRRGSALDPGWPNPGRSAREALPRSPERRQVPDRDHPATRGVAVQTETGSLLTGTFEDDESGAIAPPGPGHGCQLRVTGPLGGDNGERSGPGPHRQFVD